MSGKCEDHWSIKLKNELNDLITNKLRLDNPKNPSFQSETGIFHHMYNKRVPQSLQTLSFLQLQTNEGELFRRHQIGVCDSRGLKKIKMGEEEKDAYDVFTNLNASIDNLKIVESKKNISEIDLDYFLYFLRHRLILIAVQYLRNNPSLTPQAIGPATEQCVQILFNNMMELAQTYTPDAEILDEDSDCMTMLPGLMNKELDGRKYFIPHFQHILSELSWQQTFSESAIEARSNIISTLSTLTFYITNPENKEFALLFYESINTVVDEKLTTEPSIHFFYKYIRDFFKI